MIVLDELEVLIQGAEVKSPPHLRLVAKAARDIIIALEAQNTAIYNAFISQLDLSIQMGDSSSRVKAYLQTEMDTEQESSK